MSKRNYYGKVSCILGVPALSLCMLAAYSEYYRVADRESPFLSVVVNWALTPVNKIKGLFTSDELYVGPSMESLGLNHVFENEAITIFFTVGILLSSIALMVAIKAAKRHEHSIWYANGTFACISCLFLVNGYAGALAAAASLAVIFKVRGAT